MTKIVHALRAVALGGAALAILVLSGCGPMYETQYTLTPPGTRDGRMCVNQCQQGQTLCRQGARLERQSCIAGERQRAMMAYQAYVNERTAQKAPLKKTPADFEQSWRCNDSSQDEQCEADFRTCFANCGGQVTARQVCTAFCD